MVRSASEPWLDGEGKNHPDGPSRIVLEEVVELTLTHPGASGWNTCLRLLFVDVSVSVAIAGYWA